MIRPRDTKVNTMTPVRRIAAATAAAALTVGGLAVTAPAAQADITWGYLVGANGHKAIERKAMKKAAIEKAIERQAIQKGAIEKAIERISKRGAIERAIE